MARRPRGLWRRLAPCGLVAGLVLGLSGGARHEALACGGNARVTPCSQSVAIAKGNGFVIPYRNVPTSGTVGFTVFANEWGACAPPSGPISISGQVVVNCPGIPPFVGGTFGPIPGSLGANTAGASFNIPGGLFGPGVRSLICTLRVNYTVTFANGNVLTGSGDTAVCLVEESQDLPGEPRLDLSLLTPEIDSRHGTEPFVTSYLLTNNDLDNSWRGTVRIQNETSSRLPGIQVGPPASAVSFSDPEQGDHWPLAFVDDLGDPCLDITQGVDPRDVTIPAIERQITLEPGESRIVDVVSRGFSRCPSGSCNEQIAVAGGQFSNGDDLETCAGAGMVVDNTLPPQYPCDNSGAVLRPDVVPGGVILEASPLPVPGERWQSRLLIDPEIDLFVNDGPLPPLQPEIFGVVDDQLGEYARVDQFAFPGQPIFPDGVRPGDTIVVRGQGQLASPPSDPVQTELRAMDLVGNAPTGFDDLTPFAEVELAADNTATGTRSLAEMLYHMSVRVIEGDGFQEIPIRLQGADWQIVDPVSGRYEFELRLATFPAQAATLSDAVALIVAHDLRGAAVPLGEQFDDCNDNGIPDDVDIASGESVDFNSNGIPDECETQVAIDQTSWLDRGGGFTERFSDIGQLRLVLPEPPEDQPLWVNAVVNGQWLVQNAPIIQINELGAMQPHTIFFPITQGNPGQQIDQLELVLDVSPEPLGQMPLAPPIVVPVNEEPHDIGTFVDADDPFPPAPVPGLGEIIDNPVPAPGVEKKEVRRRLVPGVNEGVDECTPGSAARSLAWLNELYCLGFGEDCDTAQELHDELKGADRMMTNMVSVGTTGAKWVSGINEFIENKAIPADLAKKLKVQDKLGNDSPQELFDDLAKGKDIMGGFFWNTGGGHSITVVGAQKCGDMITIFFNDDLHGENDQGDGKADDGSANSAKLVAQDTDGDGVNDSFRLRGIGGNRWAGYVSICVTPLTQLDALLKWLEGDTTGGGDTEGIGPRLERYLLGDDPTLAELNELKKWSQNSLDIACFLLENLRSTPGIDPDTLARAQEIKDRARDIHLSICLLRDIFRDIGVFDESLANNALFYLFLIATDLAPPITDSLDCDANGFDDRREIELDPSLDANGDGVLDACQDLCPADLTGPGNDGIPDGILDANDFFFYLQLFASGNSRADLTGPDGTPDGIIDANDFFRYLQLFSDGCP